MSSLWRISTHSKLDGLGGVKASARWHTKGKQVIYLGESSAVCLLEVLSHTLENSFLPIGYKLLEVAVPISVSRFVLTEHSLNGRHADWFTNQETTRRIGDEWLGSRESALLEVPSVVIPGARNTLLNPLHVDAKRLSHEVLEFSLDVRLQQLVEHAFKGKNIEPKQATTEVVRIYPAT